VTPACPALGFLFSVLVLKLGALDRVQGVLFEDKSTSIRAEGHTYYKILPLFTEGGAFVESMDASPPLQVREVQSLVLIVLWSQRWRERRFLGGQRS